jgi:hypothetical protein
MVAVDLLTSLLNFKPIYTMGCNKKNPKKQFDLNIYGTSSKLAMVWRIWRQTIAEIFPPL